MNILIKIYLLSFLVILAFAGGPKLYSPCGTFIDYNPQNHPNLPALDGFSAGTYKDGSQAYIGIGFSNNCRNQSMIPARISTQNQPGAYMTCGEEKYDGISAKYLRYSPQLRWINVNANNVTNVPGALWAFNNEKYHFYFGRITVNLDNGTSFVIVSKIHYDAGASGFWYIDESGNEVEKIGNFDVLECVADF